MKEGSTRSIRVGMYVTRNRCPMCTSFVGKRTTLSAYIYLARLITDGVKPHTTRHNDRKRNLDSSPATRINTTRLEGSTSKSQTPASHTSLIKSIPPRKFHLWPESRYSLFTHHSTTPPAQSHYRPDKKKPRARPNRGTAKSIGLVYSSRLTRS